jgi:AraC-like DNA-binding protein
MGATVRHFGAIAFTPRLWQLVRTMISFLDLDMMARGGALALLMLWCWLLIRDHWHALPARMAVAMSAAVACHIIASIPGTFRSFYGVEWLIEIGSASVPGFFWLFARTWFNDEERIGWRSWALVSLPIMLLIIHMLMFEAKGPVFMGSGFAMRAMWFALAAAGLWAAWRGRDDDLIEARRKLRSLMVWAVGIFVIITNAVEIAVGRGFAPEAWRSGIEMGIAALTGGLCAAMFGMRQPDLFAAAPKATTNGRVADDPVTTAFADRLQRHMQSERPYRDDTLTVAGLAAQLGEQEYRLRRLINGHLGYRNFAAFLNSYRLAEVKQALSDPDQREVPILTIALDAGFGSLGPFNRAFREAEGMTPTTYRGRAG